MSKHKRPSIRRTAEQTHNPEQLRTWCRECSRWSYAKRDHTSDERRRLRHDNPDSLRALPIRVYRCPQDDTRWHVGLDFFSAEDARLYYVGHGVAMGDK